MKKLFLACLTILSFNSFGQSLKPKLPVKASMGLTFSADRCYRNLSAANDLKWVTDSRDTLEVPKFGFTSGLTLLYTIGEHLSVESGLLFSDKGYRTEKLEYFGNTTDPHIPQSGRHNHHFYYLDVPVKINYAVGFGKLKAFLGAGTSANFFLSEKRTTVLTYPDGRTEKSNVVQDYIDYQPVNFAVLASAGLEFNLNENLRLRVEPIYRRSVNSINDTPIKGYLYSAGLNVGLFGTI